MVKGRENDPLLHASWWTLDQHSAVIVVALAAILGGALVSTAVRFDFRKWWVFIICGIIVGDFPATFYFLAAPDGSFLPLKYMYVRGTFCGGIAGIVFYLWLRRGKTSTAA